MELNLDCIIKELEIPNEKTELARRIIIEAKNCEAKRIIEETWRRANKFYMSVIFRKQQTIKNFILEYDENGAFSLKEFTKFYIGVKDELREIYRHGNTEQRKIASDIAAIIDNRVGDIKIDQRITFSRDEYYKEAIKVISEILRTDRDCKIEWVMNIRKAYLDCERMYIKRTGKRYINLSDKHKIANEAVECFMRNYFKDCKEKYEKIPITLRELKIV